VPESDAAAVRVPALATLVVGLLVTLVAGILKGGPAVVAGLLGTAVVVVFFTVGQVVVGRVLRTNPQVGMTAAMLVYVLQILVLLVLLLVLRDQTGLDPKVFGMAVFAGLITWTLASVVVYSRSRRLTVVPGSGPGTPEGGQ
jgi:hypothetical protein